MTRNVPLQGFIMLDASQARWQAILEVKKEEARSRALSLISEGHADVHGCIVTDTETVRKVRFNGSQFPAYRFIYCALTETVPSYDDVIRHRCHNRRCINPDHLTIGSRADNKRDDYEYWANGVDRNYL